MVLPSFYETGTENGTDGINIASVNQSDNTDGFSGKHIFLSVSLQDQF